MRSALLRGREHGALGVYGAISEANVAIAISRGGYAKQYAFVDPNEDAAAFALGSHGVLLAVADGHSGFEAAEVALEHLLENPAPHWTDTSDPPANADAWRRHALAALADAAVQIGGERRDGSRSRTTLTLALALPRSGHCYYAAIGDSHLFASYAADTREVAPAFKAGAFLGDPAISEKLGEHARFGAFPLAGVHAVVIASDGLSEEGIGVPDPAAAVHAARLAVASERAAVRPLALARAVCEAACASHRLQHSGDNIACAVLDLPEAGEHPR
ncbi:MAG TPA: protein phosphatase 2C domain-containing protein [Myxococcota bacterium]